MKSKLCLFVMIFASRAFAGLPDFPPSMSGTANMSYGDGETANIGYKVAVSDQSGNTVLYSGPLTYGSTTIPNTVHIQFTYDPSAQVWHSKFGFMDDFAAPGGDIERPGAYMTYVFGSLPDFSDFSTGTRQAQMVGQIYTVAVYGEPSDWGKILYCPLAWKYTEGDLEGPASGVLTMTF